MLEYLVFRLLSVVVPLVPARPAYWLCDRLGDVAWSLLPKKRRTVMRNLSRVPREGDGDLARRARQLFREGAKYYYDTFRIPSLSPKDLERLIDMRGWEHLEQALAIGKGAMVFTAHLGSPALVAPLLAARGCKVTTPAEPVKPQKLFDLMARVRGAHGIRFVPLGPTVIKELAKALRRNEVVGIVGDRDIQKTGVRVQIFGGQTTLSGGPILLAIRTGAAVLPGFTYRRKDGHFDAFIGAPLEIERTGNLKEDIRLNAQKLARLLERAIERSPEQWVVFEPIWQDEGADTESGAAG